MTYAGAPDEIVTDAGSNFTATDDRGTMAQRAKIIRECREHVVKMRPLRLLNGSIKKHKSASVEESEKVHHLPPGSPVLVYRESDGWSPCPLVRVEGNSADVILPSGKISIFALSSVRLYSIEPEKQTSNDPLVPVGNLVSFVRDP